VAFAARYAAEGLATVQLIGFVLIALVAFAAVSVALRR
jgi:hypothetical protein